MFWCNNCGYRSDYVPSAGPKLSQGAVSHLHSPYSTSYNILDVFELQRKTKNTFKELGRFYAEKTPKRRPGPETEALPLRVYPEGWEDWPQASDKRGGQVTVVTRDQPGRPVGSFHSQRGRKRENSPRSKRTKGFGRGGREGRDCRIPAPSLFSIFWTHFSSKFRKTGFQWIFTILRPMKHRVGPRTVSRTSVVFRKGF